MSYTICSLAIGKKYFDISDKTCKTILDISKLAKCLIVTDRKEQEDTDRLIYSDIQDTPTTTKDGRYFNYNLKFLPIKQSIVRTNSDFIIYIDGDWGVLDTYNDQKFLNLFDIMNKQNIDFIFERPHGIGHSKHQGRECFWCHKVPYYDLLNTTKYDQADVCNEQCLVFKNNTKLQKFTENWENLFWKTYKENIWPFAEGLEIGMSTVEANMNCSWHYMKLLSQCFNFYSVDGGYNERF